MTPLMQTIENLRERPRDERKSIALAVSIVVMGILFLGWVVLFFRSTGDVSVKEVPGAYNNAVASVQEAVGSTGWVSSAPENAQAYIPPPTPVETGDTSGGGLQLIDQTVPAAADTSTYDDPSVHVIQVP
jgi:hypothetical protein